MGSYQATFLSEGFSVGLLRIDSWYHRGRTWSCFLGTITAVLTGHFASKNGKHHIEYRQCLSKIERREQKEDSWERKDWMCLTVSYGKAFIYWVWGTESSNSEFDSHYYFLAWVTWELLGACVICHDISEGDEDKNSAHLRKNSFFWPPAQPPTVHTFFFHFFKQMCQRISKHIYQNGKIINYNKVSV